MRRIAFQPTLPTMGLFRGTRWEPALEELPLAVVPDVDRLWRRRGVCGPPREHGDWYCHREHIIVFDGVKLGSHVRYFLGRRPYDGRIVRWHDLVLHARNADVFAHEILDHDLEDLEHGVVLRAAGFELVSVVTLGFAQVVVRNWLEEQAEVSSYAIWITSLCTSHVVTDPGLQLRHCGCVLA